MCVTHEQGLSYLRVARLVLLSSPLDPYPAYRNLVHLSSESLCSV